MSVFINVYLLQISLKSVPGAKSGTFFTTRPSGVLYETRFGLQPDVSDRICDSIVAETLVFGCIRADFPGVADIAYAFFNAGR